MSSDPMIDLSSPQSVHIVAIGGSGMSAIATVLAGDGHRISGSNMDPSPFLDRLTSEGLPVYVGSDPTRIPDDCAVVVHSTAVPADDPELVAARERGIPVVRRATMLAAMSRQARTIAVAGSHGKTTTSSMLTLMLRRAGLQPSFVIGGDVTELGTNAGHDEGDLLVVEADESDGTFLELMLAGTIITNVEPDHLDYYGGFPELVAAFEKYAAGVDGPVVICADDDGARALVAIAPAATTYGFAADADVRIGDYIASGTGSRFTLVREGQTLATIELPVAGRHNALNATGAAVMALELGAPASAIAEAMAAFGGVARRFQYRGERDGVTYIDDYAHLPSEVQAAIAAAREGGWNRVVVVFQPHRYSRTNRLWQDFAGAFDAADLLVVTGIYTAGEAPIEGVTGRLVHDAVTGASPALDVRYVEERDDVAACVSGLVEPGDLVLTLGAGDLTRLPDELLSS